MPGLIGKNDAIYSSAGFDIDNTLSGRTLIDVARDQSARMPASFVEATHRPGCIPISL